MSTIVIPGPSLLYVTWGCRRCGHRGGQARTTVPMMDGLSNESEVMRNLLAALRRKLTRVHLAKQGCLAVVDDFIIEATVPKDKTLAKRI